VAAGRSNRHRGACCWTRSIEPCARVRVVAAAAPRNPLIADLSTMAAVGYALAGGVGAAVLAMVAPMLMHNYTDATSRSGADRPVPDSASGGVACHLQFLDAILLAA
jgi:hypothetical protein